VIATDVVQAPNDKQQIAPMLEKVAKKEAPPSQPLLGNYPSPSHM